MSENLDPVRSIYADWERGDSARSSGRTPKSTSSSTDGPAPGISTGVAGMTKAWRDMLVAWDNLRVEVDEYRELDDRRILVLFRFSARGKTSEMDLGQVQAEVANLLVLRDNKVTRLVTYWDRDRALAGLGLAE